MCDDSRGRMSVFPVHLMRSISSAPDVSALLVMRSGVRECGLLCALCCDLPMHE